MYVMYVYTIIYACIYTYIGVGGKACRFNLLTLLDKVTYYIFDKINKRVKCFSYLKSYQLVANSQGSPLIFVLQNKYEHDVFT